MSRTYNFGLQPIEADQSSMRDAFLRSGRLHKTYAHLNAYQRGFAQENPNRNDVIEAAHMKRWTDSVLFTALKRLTNAYSEDAGVLSRILSALEGKVTLAKR